MKKIILLTAFMACLIVITNAQTTLTEYRYVTTGLKDDLSKGKDIKPGYYLEKIGTEGGITSGGITRNAQLYYFKKGIANKAFMVKLWDSESNYNYYCIPTEGADPELWNMAFKAISDAGKEWHIVFAWALAKVVSQKL